jgi:hypothetical protein
MTDCETPNDASVRAITGDLCAERHERIRAAMCVLTRGRSVVMRAGSVRVTRVRQQIPTRNRQGCSPGMVGRPGDVEEILDDPHDASALFSQIGHNLIGTRRQARRLCMGRPRSSLRS